MSDLFTAQDRLALGLELAGSPRSVTQAAGLGNLAPSSADQAAGLLQPPPAPRVGEQNFSAYFNPATNQMFAGGRTFDARDVGSALQAAQSLAPAPPPPGGGWQPLNQRNYADFIAGLAEPRGTGELLARGARGVVGGLVGGVGRGVEMLGAPQVGGAIAGAGEAITGQDEFDQQRSALIRQRQGLGANIFDAVIEGVPSVFASIGAGVVGGIAGGALAGPAGAAAGAAAGATLARARTIGAIGGLVATSFPQQLNTFYEAASRARTPDGQPAYDVNDPQTRLEILGGAVGTTLLDVIAPGRVAGSLSRALTDGVQEASTAAVTGIARARSVGGAAGRSGLEEAATEATQTLLERAVFDPEFRRQLTANDWKALAPYIAEQYGEDILIAAGAGAFLGAGFGGAGRFIETRPRDILQGAGEQPQQEGPAPPQVEPPAQGELFPGATFGTPPVYDGSLATPAPPRPGTQTEMFPGVELGALGVAPPPASAQGNLFDQRPAMGAPQAAEQLGLPFAAPQPSQREMFPGVELGALGAAPAIPAEQPTMGTPTDGGQRDLFGFALSPQFVPPPPVVPQRPPVRTAENLIPPSPSVPTGMEGLLRGGAQPATAPLAESEAGNRLLALRRQMELQQAEAQRAAQPPVRLPTAAEQDFDRAEAQRREQQAQAAMATPIRVEPDSVATSKDRGLNNARRNLVERFNGMTVEQQNDLLVSYDNDPLVFQDAVARMDITAVRQALTNPEAALARVRAAKPGDRLKRPRPAEAAAPAPTPTAQAEPTPAARTPAPKAANLRRGTPSAAEARPVAESRVEQRPAADEGGAAPKAGRGDSTLRRGAQPQAKAQTQEVAAAEAAPPRPLEQPAPARAAAPRPNYDALIDRAERNGELRELRADLEARIERESTAGRSTTELTQAIDKIDERLAAPAAAATAEGVRPPTDPMSRWAAVMDDEGAGYNRLSPEAKREWDRLVDTGTLPTAAMARQVERDFPNETTQRKLAVIARRKKQLDDGLIDNERQLDAIFKDLNTLAADTDPAVAAAANAALGRDTGNFSLADWNTRSSNWKNADGSTARPLAPGRVKLVVQNFLSKLATKPKVTVVANQQALRTSNPALYARAKAARAQGDFDTANAAGYAFGDGNVIIFTDRIANEQHLRFVLAHETFGHFGLRGIMPRDKFDAAMESIYDTDPQAKLAVDAAMNVRGLSKPEAVEEYLSDYAALLNTSTVARVWNAIKRFLNALGVKSGDSMTRYLLDQSRRYVRDGQQGAMFDTAAVAQRLHTVETGANADGRYSPAAAYSAGAMAQTLMDKYGGLPTNMGEAIDRLRALGSNFGEFYNEFKNKYLRLTIFKAQDNPGAFAVQRLVGMMNTISMSLKTRMNESLRAVMNSNKKTQDRLSKAMYAGRGYKLANFDAKLLNGPSLFSVNDAGEITPNASEVEKLFNAGLLSIDQIRKGFKWTRTLDDGTATDITDTFEGYGKDFTDADYEKYKSLRRVMMDARLEVLRYQYSGMLANRDISFREMKPLLKDGQITREDRAFVDAFVKKYGDLRTENSKLSATGLLELDPKAGERAEEFLKKAHEAFLGDRNDRDAAVRPFFESEADADKFIAQMTAMKQRRLANKDLTETQRFILQNEVKALFLNSHDFKNQQRNARKEIVQAYIPTVREGQWQTRLAAYVNGKTVEVKDVHQQLLIYSQFGSKDEAKSFRDGLNKDLEGQTFELLVRNEAGNFEKQTVTLRAESGRVLDAVSVDPQLNLQQFLYGLSLFNIDVNPRVMEKIVTRLTRQGAGARGRLEFSQTPGYDDTKGIYAVSRYTERMASVAAREATRPALRELLNLDLPETFALWNGNEAGVERLRKEYARVSADPNATAEAKAYYKGELARAEHMLRQTQPEDGVNRRSEFYNDAAALLQQLDGNQFVDESDFFADPLMARIRAWTAMAQLGGSVAQAVLNSISPYTNFIPYMASKDAKSGFGGGFSTGKAVSEYHRAFIQIGAPGAARWEMNDSEFYTKMANDPAMLKKFGMTAEEARVVAREILDGKLQPAQNNALMGMARGTTTNKWALQFMDKFMAPFNLSEQAARRAAFLSAYRLYRERALAAGLSERDASNDAREKAVMALDLTLGEYSVMNRPPAWRSGPTQFLYMYKVYPTTVIQLLKRLDRTRQLSMLGGLWLLSGVTGLPFAEDLEDLIDTLAQQLGFQQGSIRAEIIRHLEEVIPGWSPIILKGWINQFGLADVAARTGMGNILPGTSIALAGSNVARELGDIAGPAAGFLTGLAGTARDIITYPFSSTKTLEDIARNSPVTLLRMMGDAYAYHSSGAVVDRRGYVVSPEMDGLTIAARLFGFYPERAATQYDIIRIATRETDYQKEVVAAYRQAWIKATMRGDTAGAQEIVDAVRAWNEGAQSTALEITRFLQNSQRALREAQRGAGERALRAAPRAAREDIQGYIDALTE